MRNHSGNKSILITGFEVVDNVGVNRIKVEYTVDEITWIEIGCRTLDVPEKKVKTAEPWDVSELPDGIYYVRVQAEDTAGNWSEPSDAYFYIVDHIDPEAPYGIELISTAGYVDIMWKYNAEADFAYFELYRSETIDGIYEVISPIFYEYLRYLDRDVEEGKTYFYKVAAFDIAGNRSEYSEIVSGGLTEDRDPPYLSLYSPRDSAVLAQKTHFEVNVADDSALETLLILPSL